MLFIFILLISFQFIGVFFIDQLQSQSVTTFKETWNTQSNFLINNVRPILESSGDPNQTTTIELQLTQTLATFTADEATKIQILDNEGYVRAINQSGLANTVGQRVDNDNALAVIT